MLGVKYQTIGQYETGRTNAKLETLKKFAGALKISVNDLLSDSIEIKQPFSEKIIDWLKNWTHRRDMPEMEMILKNSQVQGMFVTLLEALYRWGDKRYRLVRFLNYIIQEELPGLSEDDLQILETTLAGLCCLKPEDRAYVLRTIYILKEQEMDNRK